MLFTVSFPIDATVGVTVQCAFEAVRQANAFVVQMKVALWDLVRREDYPGFRALEVSLHISLNGIGSLHSVAMEKSVGNASSTGLHEGGTGGQILKHRGFPALVLNVVASENDSALLFAKFIGLR